MPRMSKRSKREWGLFINPKTGRKNYNDLCRKCKRRCKQSYRVIVISCRRFAPNWGRKSAPDLRESEESEGPIQQHQPTNKRRLGRKETGKIALNIPLFTGGTPNNGSNAKSANERLYTKFHPFGGILSLKYPRLGDAARLDTQ